MSAPLTPAPRALLDRAGGENFPVASRLLPRRQRDHLIALYGFARLVDWAGDEAPGDRLALLDDLETDLDRLYAGDEPRHELLRRLEPTVTRCALPDAPFRALIAANRRDQRVHRYPTFEALLEYCALSANPIGRLVLHVFGCATPERIELSDAICTALQLAEHWQDVAEDAAAGRIYLPLEDLERFGCSEAMLSDGRAGRLIRDGSADAAKRSARRAERAASPELRALLAFEVERARGILERGAPLVATLRGRDRLAVAGFVGGGHAALDAIARRGFDVLAGAPSPRRRDVLRHALRALLRGPAPRREGSPQPGPAPARERA